MRKLSPMLYQDVLIKSLDEDIGQVGDITGDAVIPADCCTSLVAQTRQHGVLAGIDVAAAVFELVDTQIDVEILAEDGAVIQSGQSLFKATGNARSLLLAERTALNMLSHLSGIATETAKLVSAIAHTNAKICCTRKTTPGLRALEKYAVVCGGGKNHRFGLHDAMMIKDNHIAIAGGLKQAVTAALDARGHTVKLEVEVDTLDQLEQLLKYPIDVVLLDNMAPEVLSKAVAMVDGRFVCEASGGITQDTVAAIANSGVDLISSGWITHSAPALDIGLDYTAHG